MPPNVTCEAAVKLVPVMTTVLPTAPVAGVKLVMVGGTPTTNGVAETAVPPGVVTLIRPLVVPAATVAVRLVAEPTVNVAAVPLMLTAVAPVRFVPLIATTVPPALVPLVGAMELTCGRFELNTPPETTKLGNTVGDVSAIEKVIWLARLSK